jgi:hypothetical protein
MSSEVAPRRPAPGISPAAPESPAPSAEAARWRAVAADLGVGFVAAIRVEPLAPTRPLPPPEVFAAVDRLMFDRPDGGSILIAAPGPEVIAATRAHLERMPELRDRLFVATPRSIRAALLARWAPGLTRAARDGVEDVDPTLSARRVGEPWQIAAILVVVATWLAAAFDGSDSLVVVWTALFFAIGFARAVVADDVPQPIRPPPVADDDLPSFAVLVAVHREAAVIGDLVAALGRIDYPADRLALRLVVEADDAETVAAAEAAIVGTAIETVMVPPSEPRTKPKALNFALRTVDAEFVSVFDAEDRPAPDQLRRAAAAFRHGPSDLAVVQAALEIDHVDADRPWLVRQFEMEYAMLFHGLLPWLAIRSPFLPLGGTSNHFRRSALVAVGGWDPHNVTEDVDVALRLARAGHRLGIVASATDEEAPADRRRWIAQRIRWQKGWMQTWLVHMRRPRRLHRELGFGGSIAFHMVVGGQIATALAYLPSLVVILLHACGLSPLFGDRTFVGDLVLVAGLFAHAIGVIGGIALARETGRRIGLPARIVDLVTMPVYWGMISWAAWRGLHELFVAPHRWNKTSHGHVVRRGGGGVLRGTTVPSPPCAIPSGEAIGEASERA